MLLLYSQRYEDRSGSLTQRMFGLPVAKLRAPGAAGSLRPATGGLKIGWTKPLRYANLWGLYRAVEFPARPRGDVQGDRVEGRPPFRG